MPARVSRDSACIFCKSSRAFFAPARDARTTTQLSCCWRLVSSSTSPKRCKRPRMVSSSRSAKRCITASMKRICSLVETLTKFLKDWFSGSMASWTAAAMFSVNVPFRSLAMVWIRAVCSCW